MQSAVLEAMGPGVRWADMQELAYKVMCERLLEAGLLTGELEAMAAANVGAVLMPDGLGIDAHDVGGCPPGIARDERGGFEALRMQRTLEPGTIVAVESGVCFAPLALERAKANPVLSPFFDWSRMDDFANFGGIRLEDNVHITQAGIENLAVAPRSPEEVEAVMRGEIADSAALKAWRREKAEAEEDAMEVTGAELAG